MNTFDFPGPQIILVRPGTTDLDEQGRITGSLDIPLSLAGEEQVRALAESVSHFPITRIYTGPSLSARQTAREISNEGRIKIHVDENLMNLNCGLWHGKRIDELKTNQPRLFRQWIEQPQIVCPPDGESIDAVVNRLKSIVKKIRRKHKSGCCCIVAAEPLACILTSLLENIELADCWTVHNNCGTWSEVRLLCNAAV
jgi:broad specificity phosphatase PhoE